MFLRRPSPLCLSFTDSYIEIFKYDQEAWSLIGLLDLPPGLIEDGLVVDHHHLFYLIKKKVQGLDLKRPRLAILLESSEVLLGDEDQEGYIREGGGGLALIPEKVFSSYTRLFKNLPLDLEPARVLTRQGLIASYLSSRGACLLDLTLSHRGLYLSEGEEIRARVERAQEVKKILKKSRLDLTGAAHLVLGSFDGRLVDLDTGVLKRELEEALALEAYSLARQASQKGDLPGLVLKDSFIEKFSPLLSGLLPQGLEEISLASLLESLEF